MPKYSEPLSSHVCQFVITCNTIYIPPLLSINYEGEPMTTPNTLISLRITDEEVALLDARIGLDGARNRSDVIRAAIRSFLEDQPLLPDMDTITIPVGRSMKSILGDLYELHGISHQQAASQGLQDYVRKMIQEEAQLNEILAEGLEVARSKTVGRKEFTE